MYFIFYVLAYNLLTKKSLKYLTGDVFPQLNNLTLCKYILTKLGTILRAV
jgi:hypothetical protein